MNDVGNDPMRARGRLLPPFQVWFACRAAATLGAAIVIGWFVWAILCLFGQIAAMPPVWLGIVGVIFGAGNIKYRSNENLPPLCEIIVRLLAPKHCAACGQSIFDHRPPAGYAPEDMGYSYWPLRQCANCGADMTKGGAAA